MKPLTALGAALHPFLFAYFRYAPLQKGKQRLLQLVGRYLLPGQPVRRTRLKVADLQMACDLRHFIQRQLYFLGEYEAEQVALWQQLAQRGGSSLTWALTLASTPWQQQRPIRKLPFMHLSQRRKWCNACA